MHRHDLQLLVYKYTSIFSYSGHDVDPCTVVENEK